MVTYNAILRVLSYFHFFRYPLTKDEIWRYLPFLCSRADLERSLSELEDLDIIYNIEGFYSLANDTALVARRNAGNKYAIPKLAKAYKIAGFLGKFPFVECICISGSLSKDFSTPKGDLDFFIITSANRLWIARTFMHAFKKLTFLVGAQHSFCMNYYVSCEHLDINPKNVFTAIELATLKPAFIRNGAEEMYETNKDWMQIFIPNWSLNEKPVSPRHNKWFPSRATEFVLNKLGGNSINAFLFEMTKRKWIKKWQRKNYDVDACLKCMAPHFNTPLNYPTNLPEKVVDTHAVILNEALAKLKKKIPAAVKV